MIADKVIADAREYADRLAARFTTEKFQQEELSKAAFLGFLAGFKLALETEQQERPS